MEEEGGVDQTYRDDNCVPESLIKKEDSLSRQDMKPYVNRIITSIEADDSEEFAKALKDDELREEIVPSLILSWTIRHRALRCAKTLLLGSAASTGYSIDVDVEAAPSNGLSPIHMAATEFLPDFVNLFIMRGAKLEIPCNNPLSKYYSMLPLDAAITALREKISWTPAQSFHELIVSLCNQIEFEHAFITISQIMTKAPIIQNRRAICDYAKEGKIVELTILLYVDAISGLGMLKSLPHLEYLSLNLTPYFRKCTEEEVFFSFNDFGTKVVPMHKRRLMMSAMLIIDIFNKTKFSMLQFSSGHEIFEKRITDAGFNLDDVLVPENEVFKDEWQRDIFQRMPMWMVVRTPRPDSHFFDFRGMRGISTAAQTFQASQRFKSRRIMSTLCSSQDAQAQAAKASSKAPHLCMSSSFGKTWAVFASAIRRRIMYA